jgi:gliding motility-associated-like protein
MNPIHLHGIRNIKRLITLVFLVFIELASFKSVAQNFSEYNWLFGNSDSFIRFNKSDARAQIEDGMVTPFGTGGGVVISDPVTADLLFYTDGVNVYDSNHDLVPSNGAGLNGDPTLNRAAEVFPMPYSNGQYYIFTNSGSGGVNEIQYSIVDKNVAGNAPGGAPPLGDLTLLNQATGLTNPSDAMLIIQQTIDNYWLISQDRTNDEIRVTSIVAGVIGATTNYNLWTVAIPEFIASDFAYDPVNSKLAVAPQESNRNVTLFDFNVATGILTLDRALLNTGNADSGSESVYGVEWSSSGDQLYISRHGGTGTVGNLYQLDMNDAVNTVNSVIGGSVFRSYGVKRGPDQRIYHLYQQSNSSAIEVGVVEEADSTYHADSVAFNVGYNNLAFAGSGLNATQFPAFAAPHFESFNVLDFFVLDTCATQTSKFFSSVQPTPETYSWDFGDGGSSNDVSPVYTYETAGTMTVTLTVTLNGVTESVMKNVNVVSTAFTIDLGNDTIRCVGESFTLDAGTGGVSYAWNTGETSQTIEADTTQVYSVAVLTAEGCMAYDYIQVTTYEDTREFRNQWYFGENAGIDFNEPVSAIEDANLMSSPQAASSVSDLNGTIRFYTDGETVWNRDHAIMLNGDAIGGDNTSMQGVMIVPVPADTSIYYVFTSDPVWGDNTYDMKYSIVDMRKDLARGEVMFKDMSFMTNSSERMTALGLGTTFTWLITHEYGNNHFRSYPITETGIGTPITSAAGSVLRFDEEKTGTGELQVAQAGGVLAMAFQDTNDNYVEIFEINDTTGFITSLAMIDINEPAPSLVYGLEFSSSGNQLYVSTNSNGSRLIQYDLDDLYEPTAEADIEATKFIVATSSLEYGALATGSNGVMYMAVDNQGAVGTISNPNGDDEDVSFQEDGFDLAGRTSRLGLPNFVQTLPLQSLTPGITYDGVCLGQPTILEGTGTSNIDNFFWTFGDGTFAVVEDTFKTYNLSGPYDVSLRVTNRCGLDTTFLETIDIQAIPVVPTVQDAVALCNGPVTLEAWPVDTAAFSYTWSTGDVTRQINVTDPAFISVFITDTSGCQSDPAFSFVEDTSPSINLGPDQFICQNTVFPDLDAENPGSTFSWELNGVSNGNMISIQSVDTSVPGVYVYSVEVVDIFDCVGTDDITLTVQNMPDVTIAGTPTGSCGAADGEVDIDVLESGSFTYNISGPTNIGPIAVDGPGMFNENTLLGGGYSVVVANVLTGCENPQTLTIEDTAPFNIDNLVGTPGCPGDGVIEVNMSGAVPASVDYELYDAFGNLIVPGSATPVADAFTITALDSGVYSLVVQEVGGAVCIQTFDDFTLNGIEVADYTVQTQFICDGTGNIGLLPVTVDNADPIVYSWTGPSIIGSAVGDSISVGSAGTYTVTSSAVTYCPLTSTVEVVSNDSPDVSIIIDGQSCDGEVVLQAAATGAIGNLGYRWENGLRTSQRRVYDSDTYSVTVLDQGSGCVSSTSQEVSVFDELTVFLISDPNCDNNAEVNLNAYANITEDVSFTWTGPTGDPLDITGAEIAIEESGLYTVLVSSTINICEVSAAMDVAVVPIEDEELLLDNSDSFCSEDPLPANSMVILDPGTFSSYEWSLLNSTDILSTEPTFTVTEEGAYEVRLTNGFTCVRDFIEVYDDCAPIVYAPNAFTPDGNGLNDQFFVYENPYVTNFEIKIFSRWGEMIYRSNDIGFRWNGVYNGELLPGGTYVYIMTFESSLQPERGVVVRRGGVALMR